MVAEGLADGLANGPAGVLADGLAEGLADKMAGELANGLADGLADEIAEESSDRLPDGLTDKSARGLAKVLADALAGGLADGMADRSADGLADGSAVELADTLGNLERHAVSHGGAGVDDHGDHGSLSQESEAALQLRRDLHFDQADVEAIYAEDLALQLLQTNTASILEDVPQILTHLSRYCLCNASHQRSHNRLHGTRRPSLSACSQGCVPVVTVPAVDY